MSRLKKFSTKDKWIASEKVFQSVSLVGDEVYISPLHTRPIRAVFYDSSTNSFVKLYPDQITSVIETYTPIGVEVIPAEHDVYGTGECGVMSLVDMNCDSPDTGSTTYSGIMWGGLGIDTAIFNRNKVNYIGMGATLNNGKLQGVAMYAYIPSDSFWTTTKSLDGVSYYYGNNTSYPQAPSPYNSDGSRNEVYYTNSSSVVNGLSDFDGLGNTNILTTLSTSQSDWKTASTITNSSDAGYYPAACCCYRFHTPGTDQGQWYLPASGELGYIGNRLVAINDTMEKIQQVYGAEVSFLNGYGSDGGNHYWASTEAGPSYACLVAFNVNYANGQLKRFGYVTRALTRI